MRACVKDSGSRWKRQEHYTGAPWERVKSGGGGGLGGEGHGGGGAGGDIAEVLFLRFVRMVGVYVRASVCANYKDFILQ